MVLVTKQGVWSAYLGEFPRTYPNYPPFLLHLLNAIGLAYRVFVDASLDMQAALASNALSIAIKSLGILFHILLTGSLIMVHQSGLGFRKAYATGLLYGLKRAVIFDVAYWGQSDAIHTFFLALGIWFSLTARPAIAGFLLALAAWSKPHAWPILPLAAAFTWRRSRFPGLLKAGTMGFAVSLLMSVPFLLQGTTASLIEFPTRIKSIQTFASANASNLWWVIPQGGYRLDTEPWLGGISYEIWGYAFVAMLAALTLGMLFRLPVQEAPEILAFMAFGFVMLATKVHENHTFQTLVLLALAGLLRSYRPILYSAVSATLLINMALFTPDIFDWLKARIGHDAIISASVFNGEVNLAILAFWLGMLLRKMTRPADGKDHSFLSS
jgi:uncharacterized membrane protein